jgi:hypothetical protein
MEWVKSLHSFSSVFPKHEKFEVGPYKTFTVIRLTVELRLVVVRLTVVRSRLEVVRLTVPVSEFPGLLSFMVQCVLYFIVAVCCIIYIDVYIALP